MFLCGFGYNIGMKSNIRIVLINTSHPGNIGAVARAMKTMGLLRLHMVQPKIFPSADASARASGADDVLANAVVVDTLEEAVSGCRVVIGTSDRNRTIEWPQLTPKKAALQLQSEATEGDVALVFGREASGMTNDELELCHYLVSIPCNQAFSSLNLASAVQVLAYEIQLAYLEERVDVAAASEEKRDLATADEMESFFAHLQQTLVDLCFLNPGQPRQLMRRLRRLYNRAQPDKTEMNILRGTLSAAQGSKLHKTKQSKS